MGTKTFWVGLITVATGICNAVFSGDGGTIQWNGLSSLVEYLFNPTVLLGITAIVGRDAVQKLIKQMNLDETKK